MTRHNVPSHNLPLMPEPARQGQLIEHYFRFVLAERSGPIRERLQRGLIELGLKTGNPAHSMTVKDVQQRIEDSAGLPDYPVGLVAQGLNQLVERGEVEIRGESHAGDHLYRLRPGRFQLLDEAVAQGEAQDKRIRASVIARLESRTGSLDRDSEESVGRAFQRFLGRMLTTLGERCASRLVQDRSAAELDYPDIDDDLSHAVAGLPAEIREPTRLAFEEALRDPTPQESEYLYGAGQVYYIAELLHLDPELQALQRERFEDTTVFLDTNLLLATLLDSLDSHEAVSMMVAMCGAAGFTLVYGDRTAEELDDLITGAEREYASAPPIDLETAAKLASVVDNPFLRAWLESYPKHHAGWSQYRARISAWRGLLENKDVNLRQLPRVNAGDAYYQRLSKSLQAQRKVQAPGKRSGRRPRAVEHDALVVSAIRGLVLADDAPPHPFGARFWFVTLDKRLVDCARGRSTSEGSSVCMLAEEWIQYVSPFLSSDVSRLDSASAFTGLLSSRFIPQLGQRLSLDQLRVFTEPSVAALTEGLSHEEACKAVATAHREAVRLAAGKDPDDEETIQRLAALAEKQRDRHQKQEKQEAVRELTRERAAFQSATKSSAEASDEDAERIAALNTELRSARADQRSSLAFWGRRLKLALRNGWSRARAWARLHPFGAWALLIIIAAVAIAEVLGLGGTVARVIYLLAILIPLIATDAGQLRTNLRRIFKLR